MNPLNDSEFLSKLNSFRNREVFAKIIALTLDEQPIEEIQGKITSGSINVDGASAVRRTCNLSMVADGNYVNINDYYWGVKTKFKLEVGLRVPDALREETQIIKRIVGSENDGTAIIETEEVMPYKDYPDIIWFPQGFFVITSFSTTHATNNCTISISGKDKMSLLNGDLGGTLPDNSYDFATISDINEDGTETITRLTIRDIVKELVHRLGREPLTNIIINNLEDHGVELLEYKGDTPLYVPRNVETQEFENLTVNGDMVVYKDRLLTQSLKLKEIENYDHCIAELTGNVESTLQTQEPTEIYIKSKGITGIETAAGPYTIAKLEYGDTAGYRLTDLTYTGELIANAGESITSVLDKLTQMLGNFEYFYDINGKFVFQEKQNYINTSFSPIQNIEGELHVENSSFISSEMYNFTNNTLITNFQNAPQLNAVKNDFIVWGVRKTASGVEIPIHMRYVIDKKPFIYTTVAYNEEEVGRLKQMYPEQYKKDILTYTQGHQIFCTNEYFEQYGDSEIYADRELICCDWRELIWRMQFDYYRFNLDDDFLHKVEQSNTDERVLIDGMLNDNLYNPLFPGGITGYEKYYIDIQAFWRDLYNMEIPKVQKETTGPDINAVYYSWDAENEQYVEENFNEITKVKFINEYTARGLELSVRNEFDNGYRTIDETVDVQSITRDGVTGLAFIRGRRYFYLEPGTLDDYVEINIYEFNTDKTLYPKKQHHLTNFWSMTLYNNPELLNFWFDFLDSNSELEQYSVQAIGNRPKVVKDTNIKAIYFKETPKLLFVSNDEIQSTYERETGYAYIILSDALRNLFSISARGKSAKDEIDNLLYQYSYCVEQATITTIPIYQLEMNHLIKITDEETGINGDYLVTKMTVPLTYNGTMSITATKAVDRLY